LDNDSADPTPPTGSETKILPLTETIARDALETIIERRLEPETTASLEDIGLDEGESFVDLILNIGTLYGLDLTSEDHELLFVKASSLRTWQDILVFIQNEIAPLAEPFDIPST